MAATARATANISESSIFAPCNTFIPNTIIQSMIIPIESFFPKLSRDTWSGVDFSFVASKREAILPSSVFIPVEVTITTPLP